MIRCKFIITVAGLITFIFFPSTHGLRVLPKNPEYKNPFIGFYIFPHGRVIVDPEEINYADQPGFNKESKPKLVKISKASTKAAEDLIESKPDLIIFSTPHGFYLEDGMVIMNSPSAAGEEGVKRMKFSSEFEIDQEITAILYKELHNIKDAVELIFYGVGAQAVPLLYGEIIPWHFILEAADRANFTIPKAVYLGQPPVVNISTQINLGRDIVKVAILREELQDKRIVVVVSGELSHLHGKDPAPGSPPAPYEYDPISATFDDIILKWAQLDINKKHIKESTQIIKDAAGAIEEKAEDCGYSSFLLLQGMFQEVVHQGWNFDSHFYGYEAPTYFGMMVHSWRHE